MVLEFSIVYFLMDFFYYVVLILIDVFFIVYYLVMLYVFLICSYVLGYGVVVIFGIFFFVEIMMLC